MTSTTESAALFQWGVVLVASLVAALWDLKSRRIPNLLTLPLLAAGFIQAVWFDGFDGLKSSLLAMVFLGLPYVVLFVFAGGGAGDAKFMAAVGAWLGLPGGVVALVAISICAVVLALCKAIFARRFFEVLNNIRVMMVSFMFFLSTRGAAKYAAPMETADDETALTIPYGPAIFAGLVVAAVYSWLS
ncbi:MAG: A24 family peptidase [Phycisphaerae bacterium]|nr:A24 family peptidase [Phycisphaerae bacterium]